MNIIENILGAVQVAGTLLLSPLLRSGYNRWGTRPDEFRQSLPGDELAPQPQMGYTRAITIAAPPQAVWPWLATVDETNQSVKSVPIIRCTAVVSPTPAYAASANPPPPPPQ